MDMQNLVDLKAAAVKAAEELDVVLERKSLEGVDFFGMAGAARKARTTLAEAIDAIPDSDTALKGVTSSGLLVLFNASAQRSGQWQLTRFDKDGSPWGDTQYVRKLQGIEHFLEDIDLASLNDHENRFIAAQPNEASSENKKPSRMKP
jgi:hypothetical protein